MDFRTLLPRFFRRSMPLTWELSESVKREDIITAKAMWDELMLTLPE